MRIYTVVITALLMVSCSSSEKQFKSELNEGDCDSALVNLPQRDPMVKLAQSSEQAAGTVLSYAFVGASYTAEVLWDVAGGTVMFVALCGPTLALMSLGHSHYSGDHLQPVCLPGKLNLLGAPPLGRQAVTKSRPLRCPDLTSLSRSLRQVAACYEAQGSNEDLEKAERNLLALKQSKDFYQCLSPAEHERVSRQLLGIQAKKTSSF